MKAKPKQTTIIASSLGSKTNICLHPKQIWEAKENEGKVKLKYKLVSFELSVEDFRKNFEEVEE